MAKIAEKAERDAFSVNAYGKLRHDMDYSDITNAISHATCTTARDVLAKAIVVVTNKGYTARRVSKFRPAEPIVGATPDKKTYHQLSLSWGVYPVMTDIQKTTDDLLHQALARARETGLVKNGDRVVITAGLPLGVSGNTNMIKVQIVGEEAI
jgi:pyruvate kinase